MMYVLTEVPQMQSMPKFARVMGDWPKYGNSLRQKRWTDAQPVCAYSQHSDETKQYSGMELSSGKDEVAW